MNNARYHILKNAPLKCLFAVVLLLSFFAFSGYVAQAQAKLDKPQTTLVVGSNIGLRKSISYNRALVPGRFKYEVVSAFIGISRLHSYQLKILITALLGYSILRQTTLFYRPKITPQNNREAPAILLG